MAAFAESLAQQLEIWKRLVREGGLQQYPRHLDDVLEDLGPMPSYEQPSRLALWAAALVNPLPGLGVAPEIRPLLMRCNSARQRLKVAKAGVDASIRSLEALKNSWWRRAFRFILSNTSSKLWFALLVCLVAVVVDRGTGRGTANTAAPSADSVGN